MRTIKEMLGSKENVWVYLDGKETWEKFVSMAVEEGFGFGDLPAENWNFGYVVAVHADGNMGHLPLMIWCRSFAADMENVPEKVDFSKYISGSDDYACTSSHIRAGIHSQGSIL